MRYLSRTVLTRLTALAISLLLFFGASGSAIAAQLLVIGSRHCPYCLAWEREIGRSYARSDAGQRAPLRRLDIDADRPQDLFRIRYTDITPTFILVQEGREVGRIEGYDGTQAFWKSLRSLLTRLHPEG